MARTAALRDSLIGFRQQRQRRREPRRGAAEPFAQLFGNEPKHCPYVRIQDKVREASYVAAEGLSAEQFFHGPNAALDGRDTLVVLDGGGPIAERVEAIAAAVEVGGTRVVRFAEGPRHEPGPDPLRR